MLGFLELLEERDKEIDRLKAENDRLRAERDRLKEAVEAVKAITGKYYHPYSDAASVVYEIENALRAAIERQEEGVN